MYTCNIHVCGKLVNNREGGTELRFSVIFLLDRPRFGAINQKETRYW